MKEYKGFKYSIQQDYFADSPDDWRDNEVFLVYDHDDFTIKRQGFNCDDIYQYLLGNLDYDYTDYWVLPVYAHIHSNVTLSLTYDIDLWDTSMRGFMLISRNLREDLTLELAKNYAEDLIKLWNQYLNDEIFEIKIYKQNNCGHEELELIENIRGCYGEDNCEQECFNFIDNLITNNG